MFVFDSYSKLITAGKSLDGYGRERIKFPRLSVRLLCVPADAVTPDAPSLSAVLTWAWSEANSPQQCDN